MFKETGKIIELNAGQASIQLLQSENCSQCSVNSACSGFGAGARIIRLPVDQTFHVNDEVELSFESSTHLTSAVIVFLMPVFFMIAGLAFAVIRYGQSDKFAIAGTFGGLILGFILVWIINKLLAKKAVWNPIIRKI